MTLGRFGGRLRGFYYKLKYHFLLRKAVIGSHFCAYCKLEIKGPGKISIGDNCKILPSIFGQNYITLYTHDPAAKIIIGNHIVLRSTSMGCFTNIEIRANSVVEGASISDSDFHNINASKRDLDFEKLNKPVVIEENCYIGSLCIIGKGTHIGAETILLPGTVVASKYIKPKSLISGIPGRVFKSLLPSAI